MSSTILTVITKEPKVRVIFNQPLSRISGIQLVDYNFPEEHVKFKTQQTMSRAGTVLITFPPGNYSFVDLVTLLNHGISGINIHGLMSEIHLYNSSANLTFTDELKKVLNVVDRRPVGTNYSISWTRPNYHLLVDGIILGLSASHVNNYVARPTGLLAVIPSATGIFPLVHLSSKHETKNYLDLSLITSDGNEPNFDGKPFRISLRVLH